MIKSINSKDFYNKEALAAARYSTKNFWEKRYHTKRMKILQRILRNSFNNCKTFLDIGCGTGEYISFADQFVNSVYGLDISKNYLNRCSSSKDNTLVIGDIANLPFQNRAFDCVLCSEVIEHIKPNEIAVSEIFRVSHKRVIMSTPNHGLLRILMARIRKKDLVSIDASVGHVNIVSFLNLLSKFANQDWKVSFAFTKNVFPPFLDVLRFPKAAAPLIDLLEYVTDWCFPSLGSITFIGLEPNFM